MSAKLELLPVYRYLNGFLHDVQQPRANAGALWEQYAIAPFWPQISKWAPFDISFMKPAPPQDIALLKKQLALLREWKLPKLKDQLRPITESLKKEDNDALMVALYPLDHADAAAQEQQNGVAGACAFGNIILQVDPLAPDWQKWIAYVFAHEYHHCICGEFWYGPQGRPAGTLLEQLLWEGQADSYAQSLCPQRRPRWLDVPGNEHALWRRYIAVLGTKDRQEMLPWIFGDRALDIPWCAGYYFGNRIVEAYRACHPAVDFAQLLRIPAEKLLRDSRYEE